MPQILPEHCSLGATCSSSCWEIQGLPQRGYTVWGGGLHSLTQTKRNCHIQTERSSPRRGERQRKGENAILLVAVVIKSGESDSTGEGTMSLHVKRGYRLSCPSRTPRAVQSPLCEPWTSTNKLACPCLEPPPKKKERSRQTWLPLLLLVSPSTAKRHQPKTEPTNSASNFTGPRLPQPKISSCPATEALSPRLRSGSKALRLAGSQRPCCQGQGTPTKLLGCEFSAPLLKVFNC